MIADGDVKMGEVYGRDVALPSSQSNGVKAVGEPPGIISALNVRRGSAASVQPSF
jgi:hypothetical protein